jgi:hypothetical protein
VRIGKEAHDLQHSKCQTKINFPITRAQKRVKLNILSIHNKKLKPLSISMDEKRDGLHFLLFRHPYHHPGEQCDETPFQEELSAEHNKLLMHVPFTRIFFFFCYGASWNMTRTGNMNI